MDASIPKGNPITLAHIEAAYLAACAGTNPPSAGFASGAALNMIYGDAEYDPDRMYLVTVEGITLLPEEPA